MKLQGVFMIIPLLAVVASGSTIPSKTSYNVQRLEKRGNNDPASKGYTAKNSRAKLAVVSDANGGAQSPTLAQHLSLAEQLEKIGERWTQVETELQGDIDQDKEKKRARLHNLGKESYKSQHGTPNYNRGDDEKKLARSSTFLQSGRGFRNLPTHKKNKPMGFLNSLQIYPKVQRFFSREKGKPMESINSFKKKRRFRSSMNKDKKKRSVKSLNYWEQAHESQHGTDNTVLEEIRKLNQELLKKQDEITNRGASNEKLSETQAQAIVQPKSIPHVNTVSISPILSSLKPSHGRSHGTKTVPEQIDDDYRKAVEEIEAIPVKKRLRKSPKKTLLNQLNLGISRAAYKLI
ncbi:hypothetical protein BASA81_007261 [Batrachochytrium salamandrivorans]|nr:hypothetical protein BASA62_000440 [Batrachochytrium salamandrivorans]KAH9254710.1 hypothetical protein BASA81_007261 [Batrachochytrium salamandrivorans]